MSQLTRYRNKLRHERKRARQKLVESGKVKPVVMRVRNPKP